MRSPSTGFLHQHVAQTPGRHHDRLDVADRDRIHQRGAARQLRQLAQKSARPVLDNGLAMRDGAALAHIDLALQHKGKTGCDFAGLHDQGAVGEMTNLAEAAQARDVLLSQIWKHLVAARFQKCRILSHGGEPTKAGADRHP